MSAAGYGVCYALVHRLLRALPVDAAGRRVFEETLADWRRERNEAHTSDRRLALALCNGTAVFRSVALVLAREVGSPEGAGALLRLAAWTAASLVVFLALNWERLSVTVHDGRALYGYDSLGLLSVQWLASLLPALAFLSAACAKNTGSPGPHLGPALVIGVGTLVVMGWAFPAANQAFREITFARSGGAGWLAPGAAELSLPELIGGLGSAPFVPLATQLNNRLLWVIGVPVLFALGTLARTLPGWRRVAGSVMPLVLFFLPFAAGLGWPQRLVGLWAGLLTAVVMIRLLTVAVRNHSTTGDGSLAGPGQVAS